MTSKRRLSSKIWKMARSWHQPLVLALILVVSIAASDDSDWDDDDDEGARKVTAPFEVDGEVRHDWGHSNLRAWDGAVCAKKLILSRAGLQLISLHNKLGKQMLRYLTFRTGFFTGCRGHYR